MKHLEKKLKLARERVNAHEFGTQEWEDSMVIVRGLCEQIDLLKPSEEFCSVDSGFHRTRLSNGRIF